MSMSKKDFIALADVIKEQNARNHSDKSWEGFTPDQIDRLADFCYEQNRSFNRERWLGYIRGENGPNGGAR